MPNVLVFESDAAFATDLVGEFEKRGCAVTVVDDASVGLQTAASEKPDLILLTIELPRMNGFSVCNKLKRDPALKEVPLIILSSDSTEETFEQHRRLRTHAEDYVHKPVTFADLLPRITKFVSLSDSAPATSDDIVIDEEIDFEETQGSSAPAPAPSAGEESAEAAPASNVDKEVDDFAESAFGAMIEKRPTDGSLPSEEVDSLDLEAESLPPSRQQDVAAAPAQRTSTAPRPRADSIDASIKEEVARQAERIRELEKDLRDSRGKVTELEDAAKRTAGKDPEVQKLKRELDEAKAKLAGGAKPGGGGSAREYLDLREALNKKDKELLDLRDQVTHKHKELLALNDTNLGFEREKADLNDQIVEFESKIGELGRQLDSARADKDQAAKRADDFKRKIEKIQSELDARTQDLAAAQRKHEEESAQRDAREAALRVEHTEALERAEEVRVAAVAAADDRGRAEAQKAVEDAIAAADQQKELDLAEAREQAKKDRDQAVTTREGELKKEHDAKLAALHRANEEALNRLKAEHAQAMVEADKAATARFESEKAKILGEHDAKVAELEAAHGETVDKLRSAEGSLEQLTEEKAQGEASRDARIAALEKESGEKGRDIEAAKRTIEELDARLAAAEANLAATREELRESIASLGTERGKTDKAKAKWTGDKASLERAKDALAAALAQLDEIESRPLE
jgi:CheY-like chemotaxis protein